MRLKVILTSGDKTATVYALPIGIISERARRAAFKRLGLDPDPLTNHRIIASRTVFSVDVNGWRTYTIWSA